MDLLIFSLRSVQVFLPVFIGLFTCLLLRPGFLLLKLYCEYNFFSVTYMIYKYFLLDIFLIVFDEWGFLNFINSSLSMFYLTVHAFCIFSKKSSLTQKYENRLIFSSILSLLIFKFKLMVHLNLILCKLWNMTQKQLLLIQPLLPPSPLTPLTSPSPPLCTART